METTLKAKRHYEETMTDTLDELEMRLNLNWRFMPRWATKADVMDCLADDVAGWCQDLDTWHKPVAYATT